MYKTSQISLKKKLVGKEEPPFKVEAMLAKTIGSVQHFFSFFIFLLSEEKTDKDRLCQAIVLPCGMVEMFLHFVFWVWNGHHRIINA